MSKKAMGNTVLEILYAANEVWVMHGEIDTVVELIHCAKLICNLYDLKEIEKVCNFENIIVQEYKEQKADEAGEDLLKRINNGFVVEE